MYPLLHAYSTNRVSVQNLADQYHGEYHYIHPEFSVYNRGDSMSLLYYKINENELLYVRKNLEDSFSATVRVLCKVTSAYESAMLLDSNSVTLKISSVTNNKTGYAIGSIPLRMPIGQKYLLTVRTSDLMSKKEDIEYVNADKTNLFGKQNFLVQDASNGQVLISDYTDTATSLTISYNRPTQKLYVNYYRRDFPMPAPPFSTVDAKPFKYKGDSTFSLTPDAHGAYKISMPVKGFYQFQVDTTSHEGLTLYMFENHFPAVAEAYQMVPPLRYITSVDEYNGFTTAIDIKHAVDYFWLNIAGNNEERARTLIRNYYNRVQDANKYFTSYVEGWKTDRGMIYLIFGPPSIVYRTSTSESWTYGEDRNFMSLYFSFQRVNNPFSDNDYSLDRSATYRNTWYNLVDIWREGRAY